MKTIPLLIVLALSFYVLAEEDQNIVVWNAHKTEVLEAAKKYLAKFSTPKEQKRWNGIIEDRMKERELQTIALDWFYDNEQRLKDKNPKAIKEACMYFIKFVEKDVLPPNQIRGNITDQDILGLISYLNERTDTGTP